MKKIKEIFNNLRLKMIPIDYATLFKQHGLELDKNIMLNKAVYEILKIDKNTYEKLAISEQVMIYATQMNKLDLLKELENHHHITNFASHYLLKVALEYKYDEIIKYLALKNNAIRQEKELIKYWIEKKAYDVIQALLKKYPTEKNMDIFIREIVQSGDLTLLQKIVDDGFNIPHDKNLITYAVYSENVDMLNYLIEKGLNVNDNQYPNKYERLITYEPLIVANYQPDMLDVLLPLSTDETIEKVFNFKNYGLKKDFLDMLQHYMNSKKMRDELESKLSEKEEPFNKRKL